jgi:hypothetical protein
VLPYPFPLAAGKPPRRVSAGKHPAPLRDYIAIAKFFLGSFLSMRKMRKMRKMQTKICFDPLDESYNF